MLSIQSCKKVASQVIRNTRLNVMQNTRSIASTVHDCPISHINSNAPQLYGYRGATDTGSYTMWDPTDTGIWFWPNTGF